MASMDKISFLREKVKGLCDRLELCCQDAERDNPEIINIAAELDAAARELEKLSQAGAMDEQKPST